MFKYQNQAAPGAYIIPKHQGDNSEKSIPKYLEIIYDENEDEPPSSSAYEIPLPASDEEIIHDSSDYMDDDDVEVIDEHAKERTFSSSSTVSEASIYSGHPNQQETNLPNNVVLKVTLPNIKEHCTSNENLLSEPIQTAPPIETALYHDKLKRFYAETNDDNVISCDGITSM